MQATLGDPEVEIACQNIEALCILCRFYYINPVAWGIQGLIGSQLGTVTNEHITTSGGQTYSIADFMDVTYGIKYSLVGWSALILVGFTAFFALITMASLKFLNFQKR